MTTGFDYWLTLVLIVISVTVLCIVEKLKIISKITIFLNRRNSNDIIWKDVIDDYLGTTVVLKTKDGKDIRGTIAYYEEKEEPYLAIKIYQDDDLEKGVNYMTLVKSTNIKEIELYYNPKSNVL